MKNITGKVIGGSLIAFCALLAVASQLPETELKTSSTGKSTALTQVKEQTTTKTPDGWAEAAPGVYVQWCTSTCSADKVIGDNSYVLLKVWARDRSAGDIYARVNLLDASGVVVGWTNDTMYLSKGQQGVMTFSSYQDNWSTVELTEFNARG